jgi:methionine-S-sulfoxide reductase
LNPTYKEVCSGETGHAEAVRVEYDASEISFAALLDVFFTAHDPTQLNRQGNDVGTQYRSAIFYHDDAQRAESERKIAALKASGTAVVTTLEPASAHPWYDAESYHKDYAMLNPDQGYIRAVSMPKLCKVRSAFPELLKK